VGDAPLCRAVTRADTPNRVTGVADGHPQQAPGRTGLTREVTLRFSRRRRPDAYPAISFRVPSTKRTHFQRLVLASARTVRVAPPATPGGGIDPTAVERRPGGRPWAAGNGLTGQAEVTPRLAE
jgi:hypothetical protein